MKKTYTKPEIEITAFTTEDIITASGVSVKGMDDAGATVMGDPGSTTIDISEENWK